MLPPIMEHSHVSQYQPQSRFGAEDRDRPRLTADSYHTLSMSHGQCDTIQLHAEENQIKGILIRCTKWGSYNATNV